MSHDAVGIAVAQFAPAASREANLADIEEATRTAAARGARVIVFPEYSSYFVDPFDDSLAANARISMGPSFVTSPPWRQSSTSSWWQGCLRRPTMESGCATRS